MSKHIALLEEKLIKSLEYRIKQFEQENPRIKLSDCISEHAMIFEADTLDPKIYKIAMFSYYDNCVYLDGYLSLDHALDDLPASGKYYIVDLETNKIVKDERK